MLIVAFMQQPDAAAQVERIASTFGVAWPHLIAQTISFSLVCALLYWLAYRPILQMLDQRRRQIADGLANAERIRDELATTEVLRQDVLARAHGEAQSIVRDAHAAAARFEAQQLERATAAAHGVVARAHESTRLEREQMIAELRRSGGRLVLQAAAVVTSKVLTDADQRRLAEDAARQLLT